MLASSHSPSLFPRSASAYDNILTCCDDEFEAIPTSSSFYEQTIHETKHGEGKENEPIFMELTICRDAFEPNGMAFRLVGSKGRGIFIASVHSTSPQNLHLREGDRIMKCNNVSLRAVSVDQAASIIRYWMNRNGEIEVQIERRPNGENEMMTRRRRARLSMCMDQKEQTQQPTNSRVTLKMTSSKSAEVFYFPSQEEEEVEEPSSFEMKSPRYVSFDTSSSSTNPKTPICPQCNTSTRLLYLHQFSHGIMNNAFRLLTLSRSSYSLL